MRLQAEKAAVIVKVIGFESEIREGPS